MKNIMSKLMLVLFIVVLLVVALPFSISAETHDLEHQHFFVVENRVTYEKVSEDEHIKSIYSINTCQSCGRVIVDNDSYTETHEYEGYFIEEYYPYSTGSHEKAWYDYDVCIWCGDEDLYLTDSKYEAHTIERYYYETWEPFSNENHLTINNCDEICLWCGDIIRSYEIDSWYDWHEFDDSVDPEVDMDGVCIRCGDAVSW